ncbi:MAG TPA: hypothetical protein VGB95_07580 [Chitinophagales bacterium]
MKDINDFITIDRQKNGTIKITHTTENVWNLYKLLKELGYRKTKLGNKRVYYQRNEFGIKSVSILDIKQAFTNLLGKHFFTNIPKDVDYASIFNWYFKKQPIKENGVFNHFLIEALSDIEASIFFKK